MGKWRYGVILDAGSSGTRVHVYKWLNPDIAKAKADTHALESLPVLKTKKEWTKKIHPGVSTFGATPELVGHDHLAPLVQHAFSVVPQREIENTPIFLLATAGMRLLPDYQRNAVLDNICSYLREHTAFQLPDCGLHIQVIPGETEGLYGWIAANYLLGGFDSPQQHDHGKNHSTYGFLDMGGASAQIAFAPNTTEAAKHAEDLKLLRMRKVNGDPVEYRVFVTTWLGFGVNEARRRYVAALLEQSPHAEQLSDPCLPSGLTVTKAGRVILPGSKEAAGKEPHLLGTGHFSECLKRTVPLLGKDAPCLDSPCLFNGSHVPAIDFDVNHFVGVSEYWHTTHEVFEMSHKDKAYDFHTYQDRVSEFCSQDWKTIQKGVAGHEWGKKVDETTAVEVCFKASWLINMLHEGIGIPRVGIEKLPKPGETGYKNGTKEVLDHAKAKGFLDPFQAVDKIDGTEVSWTLGKMVLYAASQVPPAIDDASLAVGFGSNTPGIKTPADFQYAGGKNRPLPNDLTDDTDGLKSDFPDGNDWHDVLFRSSSSRRIP
ncbi:Golgi apyrase, partial [Elasticomyces elasticus]